MLYDKESGKHWMPGNRYLPSHEGVLVTRRLQEEACLFATDLSFDVVARVLGWRTGERSISSNTIRRFVQVHGEEVMGQEQQEAEALLQEGSWHDRTLQLVPHHKVRRRPGWPQALNEKVEAALAAKEPPPPEGVTPQDWARVLAARRQEEIDIETLRRLGPLVRIGESILTLDEVLTRHQGEGKFLEVTTARLVTAEGYRYFSGEREALLKILQPTLYVVQASDQAVTLISDGARWIREFFSSLSSESFQGRMILDWYHLRKKIHLFASMIARNKEAKKDFEKRLYRTLWHGKGEDAIAFLKDYVSQAKNQEKLQELINYLQRRTSIFANYGQRRRERRFIGSGHVEKANDLIVAQRQKHQGMAWKRKTSHALAALKTLRLNQGWDEYWQQGLAPALVAPSQQF